MEQTLEDVEFLFVDDASPDGSMEIVKRVVAEYNRTVRFLVHEKNKGLPTARNTGLEAATGEYIYHCDSDDWPELTLLEKMVTAAEKADADFVYCDFFLSFSDKERYMRQTSYSDSMEMLEKGFLAGMTKYNVWNKLVRRKLYIDNGLRFPDGHTNGEDLLMVKAIRMANKVAYVPEALYHYNRTNENAITKTYSEKHFTDIKFNTDGVISFLKEHPISNPEYLEYFKLNQKLPFLFSQSRQQYRLWKQWYPEANRFIQKNREWPFRTRMVQQLAVWHLFPLVHLYGWAVDHLFYGFLYRK
jgi:glycosyltransferase involved in cell wall biosynthesis